MQKFRKLLLTSIFTSALGVLFPAILSLGIYIANRNILVNVDNVSGYIPLSNNSCIVIWVVYVTAMFSLEYLNSKVLNRSGIYIKLKKLNRLEYSLIHGKYNRITPMSERYERVYRERIVRFPWANILLQDITRLYFLLSIDIGGRNYILSPVTIDFLWVHIAILLICPLASNIIFFAHNKIKGQSKN